MKTDIEKPDPATEAKHPAGGGLGAPPCSLTRVKMKFRCIEYHTIIREVPTAEVEAMDEDELFEWLSDEFTDDTEEAAVSTQEYDLEAYETLPDKENAQGHQSQPGASVAATGDIESNGN